MPCVAGMFKAITPIKTVVSPQRKVYAHFIITSAKESNFLNFVSPQRKVYAHFISTSAKKSNFLNFVSPQRKVYAHFISTSTCHKRWSERSPNQPTSKKEEKPGGESEKLSPGGVGHRPLMDIKALKEAPKPALWLGAGGLIPFIVPPVAMLLTGYYVPQIHESQVVYGATILSFLGGARWGVAVVKDSGLTPTWASLGYSVTLPLLAWLSLTLSPSIDIKTSIIILGLTLSLFNDIFAPGYARWFKSLRVILTFVATFSLALVNIAYEAVKEGRMLESDLKNFQI